MTHHPEITPSTETDTTTLEVNSELPVCDSTPQASGQSLANSKAYISLEAVCAEKQNIQTTFSPNIPVEDTPYTTIQSEGVTEELPKTPVAHASGKSQNPGSYPAVGERTNQNPISVRGSILGG